MTCHTKKLLSVVISVLLVLSPLSLGAGRQDKTNVYQSKQHASPYFKQLRQFDKKQFLNKQSSFVSKKQMRHFLKAQKQKIESSVSKQTRAWEPSFNPRISLWFVVGLGLLLSNQLYAKGGNSPPSPEEVKKLRSIIFTKPYQIGDEERTFGPLEILSDGSKIADHIGRGHVVESCLYPNVTKSAQSAFAHCIFFSPVRILGDETTTRYNTGPEDYVEAKKMCGATYKIAEEAAKVLKPNYVQNKNGTSCYLETALRSQERAHFDEVVIPSCTRHFSDLTDSPLLPTFMQVGKDIAKKLRLKTKLSFWFADDELCAAWWNIIPGLFSPGTNKDDACNHYAGLQFAYSFLQKFSDAEQQSVLGHELHHRKQIERGEPDRSPGNLSTINGNNKEAEADMDAVLVSGQPCLSLVLKKFEGIPRWYLLANLPTFTEDNVVKLLAKHFRPASIIRIALVLAMHKHKKKALELLLRAKEAGLLELWEREALQNSSCGRLPGNQFLYEADQNQCCQLAE